MTPAQLQALTLAASGVRLVPRTRGAKKSLNSLANRGLLDLIAGRYVANDRGRVAIQRSRRARGGSRYSRTPNPDRWAYAQSLRDAGWTLEEIGQSLGLTRERIRQKTTKRNAVSGSADRIDALRLVSILRGSPITTLNELATASGHGLVSVRECLTQLGMLRSATRLLRWRRTVPTRRRHAALIRAEYDRLGRTPTLHELATAMGVNPGAAAPILTDAFGSVRAAMRYVGIEPRGAGGPGHTRPKRKRTHCPRCGDKIHEAPCGARRCLRCRRAYQKARYALRTTSEPNT